MGWLFDEIMIKDNHIKIMGGEKTLEKLKETKAFKS